MFLSVSYSCRKGEYILEAPIYIKLSRLILWEGYIYSGRVACRCLKRGICCFGSEVDSGSVAYRCLREGVVDYGSVAYGGEYKGHILEDR